MTNQPHDVSHCEFNENEFNNLDTELSLHGDSQNTNNKPDMDSGKSLSSQSSELLATNIAIEPINGISGSRATPALAPSYHLNEQLFPGCQLDELQPVYLPEEPINEITITTTISDAENNDNDIINSTPSDSELNLNECENLPPEICEKFKQVFDQFSLQIVDNSIQQRTMSVDVQPPTNLRPRYESDGTRQIEKSRTKPMLPDLKDIELNSNQLFFLRLILITYSKNPSDPVYVHVNKLQYHSNDVQELDDGTVCVPLTPDDVIEGKKILSRLSIIKTKLEAYKLELIPYNLSGIDNELLENINNDEKNKVSVHQAKDIYKQYNMKASRIVCQLLIKQNESWYFTNIACETHVIEAKDQQNTTNKRSANVIESDEEEFLDKRPSKSKSKSTKRKKRSNS